MSSDPIEEINKKRRQIENNPLQGLASIALGPGGVATEVAVNQVTQAAQNQVEKPNLESAADTSAEDEASIRAARAGVGVNKRGRASTILSGSGSTGSVSRRTLLGS